MNLDQKISEFLSSSETRPTVSKLEPYTELIRGLRQKRWTYQQIADVLREKFGVSAAPSSIHNFVKVRSRKNTGVSTLPNSNESSQTTAVPASRLRTRFRLDP